MKSNKDMNFYYLIRLCKKYEELKLKKLGAKNEQHIN